jgi:DNA-3-methyladenine glycosylase
MNKVQFNQAYFLNNDVVFLAKAILGAQIETHFQGQKTTGLIVETEAYRAPEDKASHAHNYRRTARNEVMYGMAGIVYVYLCYGIHHLFNIVTGPPEIPHAILIRAIHPMEGIDIMQNRRSITSEKHLTNGPGKWTQAFGITTQHTGLDLFDKTSPIKIRPPSRVISAQQITSAPRIGINYAEEWVDQPWRFLLSE